MYGGVRKSETTLKILRSFVFYSSLEIKRMFWDKTKKSDDIKKKKNLQIYILNVFDSDNDHEKLSINWNSC